MLPLFIAALLYLHYMDLITVHFLEEKRDMFMSTYKQIVEAVSSAFEKWGIEPYLKKVGIASNDLCTAAAAFLGGFLGGILLKKSFKLLVWGLLFAACAIKFLEYNEIVQINWTAVNLFFGLDPRTTIDQVSHLCFEYAKSQPVLVISATFGALLGLKKG